MADQLESIVQKMIDAGESEDNIASVIKEYRPPYNVPTGHGTASMLGAPSEPYAEGVNPADRWQNKAAAGLDTLANPRTASDIGHLLMAPTDATRGVAAYVPNALGQAGEMAKAAGRLVSRTHVHPSAALDFQVTKPFQVLGKLFSLDPAPRPMPTDPETLAVMARARAAAGK